MKNYEVLNLHEALLTLDGPSKNRPDAKPFVVMDPKTTYAIARNIQAVEQVRVALEKAQLSMQGTDGGVSGQIAFQDLMSSESDEIKLRLIDVSKLNLKSDDNLDGNVISPLTMRALFPVLSIPDGWES